MLSKKEYRELVDGVLDEIELWMSELYIAGFSDKDVKELSKDRLIRIMIKKGIENEMDINQLANDMLLEHLKRIENRDKEIEKLLK